MACLLSVNSVFICSIASRGIRAQRIVASQLKLFTPFNFADECSLDQLSMPRGCLQLIPRVETRDVFLSHLLGDEPTSFPMQFLGVIVSHNHLWYDECCCVVQCFGYAQHFRLRMMKIFSGPKHDLSVRPLNLRSSDCWSAFTCTRLLQLVPSMLFVFGISLKLTDWIIRFDFLRFLSCPWMETIFSQVGYS